MSPKQKEDHYEEEFSDNTVFPLIIGEKGDHQNVEVIISADLAKSRDPKEQNSFYWSANKGPTRAHFEVISIVQDQPERLCWSDVMAGNGVCSGM